MATIKEIEETYLEEYKDEIVSFYDRHAGFVDGANAVLEEIERIIKERKEYHVNSDRWYINYDVLVNGIKQLKGE